MGWSNLWSRTLIFILLSEYISCEKEGRKGIRYTVINYFFSSLFFQIFFPFSKVIFILKRIVFSVDKVEIFLEQKEVPFLSPSKIYEKLNFCTVHL